MSRIFLGHSSANEAEAIAVHDWLIEQGWNDLFLDLDPERGIKAGQRWQEELKRAAERCEVVIFLISPAWAASKWCLAEFLLAKQLNKPIFGVIVEPTPFADIPAEMTAEWQLVDLTAGVRDHAVTVTLPRGGGTATGAFASEGLARLRIGLMQTGLDTTFFKWPPDHDPDRAPYRGLRPLEAEDAGIFFGREGPTVVALDMLRGLRDAAAPRLLVVLGASGAGKSSFMRAGLLPRLERDDLHFFPLPVIRPDRAVLTGDTGLFACLEEALKVAGLARSRPDIRTAVFAGGVGITPLLVDLVDTKARQVGAGHGRKAPTIVISIDQAEELFTAEGAEEGVPFVALLRELTMQDAPAVITLFTVRSDSYEALQTARELDGLRQHTFSLPPMPQGNYSTVITGPPSRLDGTARALKIDDALVQELLTDIDKGGAKDALPLLAFTLERLYDEYHATGRLTRDHYERLGRIAGSIEAGIERTFKAADSDARIPKDRQTRLTLLRRGLIPWLAGIDPETKAPRRRVARLSEIPAEARPLIDLLVEQRLLSTDVAKDTKEVTVEPAHEALLRRWGLLQDWLEEDAGLLTVLDGIKRAACDWAANGKGQSWLAHGAERLQTTGRLLVRPDLAANLEPTDREYITACRNAEATIRARARRRRVLIGALALVLMGAGMGWWHEKWLREQYQWHFAMGPSVLTAEQAREIAAKPGSEFKECSSGCPALIVIPAGKFIMGSNNGSEGPQQEVTIAKPFAIGKFAVTFAEWGHCVAARACPTVFVRGWDRQNRQDRPVINVSWDDARLYVRWLSRMTGQEYRLPNEAEWEYAARAGTMSDYSWGNNACCGNANCDGCGSSWEDRGTAPVGSFKPNGFGLYDMQGNVWQWVEDRWHASFKFRPDFIRNYGMAWLSGSADGEEEDLKVIRGGSWRTPAVAVRITNRIDRNIGQRGDDLGFRIARTLVGSVP